MSLSRMPFNNQHPRSLGVYQATRLSVRNISHYSSVVSSCAPKRLTISALIWVSLSAEAFSSFGLKGGGGGVAFVLVVEKRVIFLFLWKNVCLFWPRQSLPGEKKSIQKLLITNYILKSKECDCSLNLANGGAPF